MYQAITEIKNRTDGIADFLLPTTNLRWHFHDSRCDTVVSALRAIANRQLGSEHGIAQALIGSDCSAASEQASLISSELKLPMISPSSTSSKLSNNKQYPYFSRTAPSVKLMVTAMFNVLKHLFNYNYVAIVASRGPGAFNLRGLHTLCNIRSVFLSHYASHVRLRLHRRSGSREYVRERCHVWRQ